MTLDWQSLYASVLPFIPADLMLIGTFLVSLCAVIARFWPRPSDGTCWLILYRAVNYIGMNKIRWKSDEEDKS